MNIFSLPDLGEGLTEVEVVEWLIKVGDTLSVDQPMVSVETAKAIVEIPSPQAGVVYKLYGEAGDIIHVGDPLMEFEGDAVKDGAKSQASSQEDTGTVVGNLESSDEVLNETSDARQQSGATIKATPAVRALARRMDVDLSIVTPSGRGGMITADDVKRVASIFEKVGPLEPLRGVRRAMAKSMERANAEVVPVTIYDDADIEIWKGKEDITTRLIKAIIAGCEAEPALNAWYDSHGVGRRLLKQIDLGMAVDSDDGLFVPVLRNVSQRSDDDLRNGLDSMKKAVKSRNIPPEEMRGYSFTLSNFGVFGGRYANPIIIPPTVAILGAGRISQEAQVVDGKVVAHWVVPLSLTFDHRSVTGGEATRFMAVVKRSLES